MLKNYALICTQEYNNLLKYTHMKSLLKNLGLIL